jgi:acyl-CoA thioesterase-1
MKGRLLTAGLLLSLLFPAPCCRAGHHPDTPMTSRPVHVLAFGDSLTAGFGVVPHASVPARLEKILRQQGLNVSFTNAGLSGDTSAGGLARFEQALTGNPDLVMLELGANDNLQAIDPGQTETNLAAMLTLLKQRGIPALLIGVRPLRDLGEQTNGRFCAIFTRLAATYDIPLYPDLLAGVAGHPKLLLRDGLHPNSKGTKEMARRLAPLLAQLVRNIGTTENTRQEQHRNPR